MVIGLALWLREREQGRSLLPQAVPVLETSSPVVIPGELLEEGSPARKGSATGRKVTEQIELNIKRDELRTRLIGLMNEAGQLAVTAETPSAASKPSTAEGRMTQVQNEVQAVAEDRTFTDISSAALRGVEAIRSRRAPAIAEAAKEVAMLPVQ